jgi:hypothetical protein
MIDLSLRELGYDMSDYIDLREINFSDDKEKDEKLFDFVELLIIFTKSEKRSELIERINEIFIEEGNDFLIFQYMIINRKNTGLKSILPLIKDGLLKTKLNEYYQSALLPAPQYETLARISADIIQRLFSSPDAKDKTKKYADDVCKNIAERTTILENIDVLTKLLSDTIKNAKELSNQISNIRHTDQITIPVDSPNIYKLIVFKNINLAEITILSLPEKYITDHNPDQLKNSYLKKFNLDKNAGWIVESNKQNNDNDIDIKNIPF